MTETDPRVDLLIEEIASIGASEMMSGEQLHRAAVDVLSRIDIHDPNPTVRRLQRELYEAWANDPEPEEWNLWRAAEIRSQINDLRLTMEALKQIIGKRDSAGFFTEEGWLTLNQHPLYVRALKRIESLEEEFVGLA